MSFETIRLLEAFLLPPGGLLTLALIGILFGAFRFGRRLAFISVLLLYLLSTPYIGKQMQQTLAQKHPPLTPEQIQSIGAEVIVVLGGGYYGESSEYGEESIGPFFAERLRYAAWLSRKTLLPIIITSGNSDAPAAARILETQFGVKPIAVEKNSWTTEDNARNVAKLLPEFGYNKVALVTHSWHMPRSVWSFERMGIDVAAAPMGLIDIETDRKQLKSWKPSIPALMQSRNSIHEWTGILWYRYGPGNQQQVAVTSKSIEETPAVKEKALPTKPEPAAAESEASSIPAPEKLYRRSDGSIQ